MAFDPKKSTMLQLTEQMGTLQLDSQGSTVQNLLEILDTVAENGVKIANDPSNFDKPIAIIAMKVHLCCHLLDDFTMLMKKFAANLHFFQNHLDDTLDFIERNWQKASTSFPHNERVKRSLLVLGESLTRLDSGKYGIKILQLGLNLRSECNGSSRKLYIDYLLMKIIRACSFNEEVDSLLPLNLNLLFGLAVSKDWKPSITLQSVVLQQHSLYEVVFYRPELLVTVLQETLHKTPKLTEADIQAIFNTISLVPLTTAIRLLNDHDLLGLLVTAFRRLVINHLSIDYYCVVKFVDMVADLARNIERSFDKIYLEMASTLRPLLMGSSLSPVLKMRFLCGLTTILSRVHDLVSDAHLGFYLSIVRQLFELEIPLKFREPICLIINNICRINDQLPEWFLIRWKEWTEKLQGYDVGLVALKLFCKYSPYHWAINFAPNPGTIQELHTISNAAKIQSVLNSVICCSKWIRQYNEIASLILQHLESLETSTPLPPGIHMLLICAIGKLSNRKEIQLKELCPMEPRFLAPGDPFQPYPIQVKSFSRLNVIGDALGSIFPSRVLERDLQSAAILMSKGNLPTREVEWLAKLANTQNQLIRLIIVIGTEGSMEKTPGSVISSAVNILASSLNSDANPISIYAATVFIARFPSCLSNLATKWSQNLRIATGIPNELETLHMAVKRVLESSGTPPEIVSNLREFLGSDLEYLISKSYSEEKISRIYSLLMLNK